MHEKAMRYQNPEQLPLCDLDTTNGRGEYSRLAHENLGIALEIIEGDRHRLNEMLSPNWTADCIQGISTEDLEDLKKRIKAVLEHDSQGLIKKMSELANISQGLASLIADLDNLLGFFAPPARMVGFGCTGIGRTEGGEVILAQTFDIPFSTLARIRGGRIRGFTKPPYPVSFGQNDQGLSLITNHIMMSRSQNKEGVPISFLRHEILRSCETVDEAVELCEKTPVVTTAHFMIADRNGIASIEVGPNVKPIIKRITVGHGENFLAHTNSYGQNGHSAINPNHCHQAPCDRFDSAMRQLSEGATTEQILSRPPILVKRGSEPFRIHTTMSVIMSTRRQIKYRVQGYHTWQEF